nr:hypothetical protein [Azospirillum lipoferum]
MDKETGALEENRSLYVLILASICIGNADGPRSFPERSVEKSPDGLMGYGLASVSALLVFGGRPRRRGAGGGAVIGRLRLLSGLIPSS